MTKISIITVVYNGYETIEDTIISILSQENIDLEYIIIDGKSTDGTLKRAEKFLHRISHVVSEPDKGIYDAMNKGLKIASGEILGFLNADDLYYNNNILNKIVRIFDDHPSVDIVYGDLIYVEAQNTMKTVRHWTSKAYDRNFFSDGLVPPHPSFFVRKSVYRKSGYFNTSFKFAADYEIMFRFLKIANHSSIYLPEIFVRMRLGGTTNQSLSNIIKGNQEIARVWKLYNLQPSLLFWLKRNIRKISQFIHHATPKA